MGGFMKKLIIKDLYQNMKQYENQTSIVLYRAMSVFYSG